MTSINNISMINKINDIKQANSSEKAQSTDKKSVDFAGTIKKFLYAVNTKQAESYKELSRVIKGESDNLTEAMVKSEEAHLSFQLMLEIRNKVLDSYKEIKRIQV